MYLILIVLKEHGLKKSLMQYLLKAGFHWKLSHFCHVDHYINWNVYLFFFFFRLRVSMFSRYVRITILHLRAMNLKRICYYTSWTAKNFCGSRYYDHTQFECFYFTYRDFQVISHNHGNCQYWGFSMVIITLTMSHI